jgi:HD-GYP domain-containing protein (c-di-GMP phosphodiesterase class II)
VSETTTKSSLSKALSSNLRKQGKTIISNLHIALKVSQLYDFAHQNVTDALNELAEILDSFIKLEGEIELARIDDFFTLNETRITVDLGAMGPYNHLLECFKEREIGKMSFQSGITAGEISKLVNLFNNHPIAKDRPWASFEEGLKQYHLPSVNFARYVENLERREEITHDKRIVAIGAYFKGINQMKDAMDAVREQKRINLRRVKRTMQAIVDLVLDDQSTLLAMVNIKDYGDPLANHAMNVCTLSIALGAKLGLPKKDLGDLAVASLMHDFGKAALPEDVVTAPPESLPAEKRASLREHVYTGVELLLQQRIIDSIVKSINVAFLHHYRYDATGYPHTQVIKSQNIFSRIVAVANFYDNAGRRGPDGTKAWEPERILRRLLDDSGTEFDPLVVKAFVNLMGLYPVGCVVTLNTGETGTVVTPSPNPRYLDRPRVKVFSDAQGNPTDVIVNLLDRDASGNFLRSILKLRQQEEVRLELEEYLAVI